MSLGWLNRIVTNIDGRAGRIASEKLVGTSTFLGIAIHGGGFEQVALHESRPDEGALGWRWVGDDFQAEPIFLGDHNLNQADSQPLVPAEARMLQDMARAPDQRLSKSIHEPNPGVISSLVRKQLATPIMGGLIWCITAAGADRVKDLEGSRSHVV